MPTSEVVELKPGLSPSSEQPGPLRGVAPPSRASGRAGGRCPCHAYASNVGNPARPTAMPDVADRSVTRLAFVCSSSIRDLQRTHVPRRGELRQRCQDVVDEGVTLQRQRAEHRSPSRCSTPRPRARIRALSAARQQSSQSVITRTASTRPTAEIATTAILESRATSVRSATSTHHRHRRNWVRRRQASTSSRHRRRTVSAVAP